MDLEEAKQILRNDWEKGTHCPCCGQFVKAYKRNFSWASALVMIEMYKRVGEGEYIYLPDILTKVLAKTAQQGGYATLAHWWGLIQAMPGKRDDGSHRVGWWRLTPSGRKFVEGDFKVQKYAKTFNGKLYGMEGEFIDIKEALQQKFDYQELMYAR